MSTGLLALLDDVVAIAKIAAASVDDAAAMSAKAGAKAAGIVVDDAAVTPRYVVGFAPARELPIIRQIAVGSLRNKLLILLPAALALAALAPWLITPLLMAGGLYLCFEGAEKLVEKFLPHGHAASAPPPEEVLGAEELERSRVAGAIRTDFILSAEIMAITLAGIETDSFIMRAVVLAVVAVLMTVIVYGVVALIVKADDVGLAMAGNRSGAAQAVGRGIVAGMPYFLTTLSWLGTVAMLWVGGGILLHGLEHYGLGGPWHMVEAAAAAVSGVFAAGGFTGWLVSALLAAVAGLAAGLVVVGVIGLLPARQKGSSASSS